MADRWKVGISAERNGGNVKDGRKICAIGMAVFLAVGAALLSGCKSTPELTQAQAQELIQAHYDQAPADGVHIVVNDLGMRQGITAKYWDRTLIYPNHYWADFKLTDAGKKVVTLPGGGDVIQWRPDNAADKNYSVIVVTVVKNHLNAHDIDAIQDETLPGASAAKGAMFVEGVDMDGLPDPLQEIAHNPGNQLSSKRQADFTLENGVWKLHDIQ